MRLGRWGSAAFIVVAAALAVALPAGAKEGVRATLATPVSRDAAPGTKLDVSWTLFYLEDGKRRPFGAGGVFVRLTGPGGAVHEAFADDRAGSLGEFSATVVVPEGGIADVQIGLMGWRSDASGTKRADRLFPITNDPRPGVPRAASASESRDPGGGDALPWRLIGAVIAVGLVVLGGAMLLAPRRVAA